MISKKTKFSNLENKRVLFFEIGLALTLATVIVVVETTGVKETETLAYLGIDKTTSEIYDQINTFRNEPKPVIRPEVPKINIIENEADIPEGNITFSGIDDPYDPTMIYIPEMKDEPIDSIYIFPVQVMPKFKGGELSKFRDYIMGKVRYPEEAIAMQLQGRVYVQFVVDEQGNVTQVEVKKGVDKLLDNEVIAAVQDSPKWKPGKQNGKAVKVGFSMPIAFKIR